MKQQGTALITALLIVAITSSIAMLLAFRQQLNIHQAELIINANKLYRLAQGLPNWGREILIKDEINRKRKNYIPMKFITTMPTTVIDDVSVKGELQDQLGLFNINCLANPNNNLHFEKLLTTIDPAINRSQAQQITKNINQWLTQPSTNTLSGKLMVSISELRLIQGMTAKLYNQLLPYLTALPTSNYKININSAPIPILISLTPTLSKAQAEIIIDCRNNLRGFKTFKDVNQCTEKLNLKLKAMITLTSNFYLAIANLKTNNQSLVLYSLLHRKLTKNKTQVRILRQSHYTQ